MATERIEDRYCFPSPQLPLSNIYLFPIYMTGLKFVTHLDIGYPRFSFVLGLDLYKKNCKKIILENLILKK